MDEFTLIETFFSSFPCQRPDVLFGIGDDAACVTVSPGMNLLISTDTLVADVHFLSSWDAYDIAYKAAMVNISDIVAMGANPSWATLNLTLPAINRTWLERFSCGLRDVFIKSDIALIGGDTTTGPLSISLTMMGAVSAGRAIRRGGARAGDLIYVTGTLGAAALAVYVEARLNHEDYALAFDRLRYPQARLDLVPYLQAYASAAIDISDGLSADLYHICKQSKLGACLDLDVIPVDRLVTRYMDNPLDFAMTSGDDYELCFTVSPDKEASFLEEIRSAGIECTRIGCMEAEKGLRGRHSKGDTMTLSPKGYQHFVK